MLPAALPTNGGANPDHGGPGPEQDGPRAPTVRPQTNGGHRAARSVVVHLGEDQIPLACVNRGISS
jgi:hypothetical protein